MAALTSLDWIRRAFTERGNHLLKSGKNELMRRVNGPLFLNTGRCPYVCSMSHTGRTVARMGLVVEKFLVRVRERRNQAEVLSALKTLGHSPCWNKV